MLIMVAWTVEGQEQLDNQLMYVGLSLLWGVSKAVCLCVVCLLDLSCASAGFMSCCTGDSCMLESPGMPSCSCDAQCFESGDCCSDVAKIGCHPGIWDMWAGVSSVVWLQRRGWLSSALIAKLCVKIKRKDFLALVSGQI